MISTPITSPPSLGPKERDDTLPWSDLMVGNVRGNAGLLPSTRHGESEKSREWAIQDECQHGSGYFESPIFGSNGQFV